MVVGGLVVFCGASSCGYGAREEDIAAAQRQRDEAAVDRDRAQGRVAVAERQRDEAAAERTLAQGRVAVAERQRDEAGRELNLAQGRIVVSEQQRFDAYAIVEMAQRSLLEMPLEISRQVDKALVSVIFLRPFPKCLAY